MTVTTRASASLSSRLVSYILTLTLTLTLTDLHISLYSVASAYLTPGLPETAPASLTSVTVPPAFKLSSRGAGGESSLVLTRDLRPVMGFRRDT